LNIITAANFLLVGGLICSDVWFKVMQHEASANGDVILYAFYSRKTDTSDRPSNDTMMFMQSILVAFGPSQEARKLKKFIFGQPYYQSSLWYSVSSVVCRRLSVTFCIVAKRCILAKNCLKE